MGPPAIHKEKAEQQHCAQPSSERFSLDRNQNAFQTWRCKFTLMCCLFPSQPDWSSFNTDLENLDSCVRTALTPYSLFTPRTEDFSGNPALPSSAWLWPHAQYKRGCQQRGQGQFPSAPLLQSTPTVCLNKDIWKTQFKFSTAMNVN